MYKKTIIAALIGCILIGIFYFSSKPKKGVHEEGVQYFVYLFPEIDSSMNYRLPADIILERGCYDSGECDYDIQVEDVYFDNGEIKYFGCIVLPKTENFCTDQDGKEWMIVLSDWEKAKTIKEIKADKKKIDDFIENLD